METYGNYRIHNISGRHRRKTVQRVKRGFNVIWSGCRRITGADSDSLLGNCPTNVDALSYPRRYRDKNKS